MTDDTSEGVSEQVLRRVKRAQECRKRRNWEALKIHLDSAERILERDLRTEGER